MQVHVQISVPGSSEAEWVLLELQGDLESRDGESMREKFIGDLSFTKKGAPILIIGHHVLFGRVVEMNKPYIAIKKCPNSQTEERVEYVVEAVIRKKLLFKARPKPIIISGMKT